MSTAHIKPNEKHFVGEKYQSVTGHRNRDIYSSGCCQLHTELYKIIVSLHTNEYVHGNDSAF